MATGHVSDLEVVVGFCAAWSIGDLSMLPSCDGLTPEIYLKLTKVYGNSATSISTVKNGNMYF
ncbi:hypothetical protein LAZ67_6003953 [Cordylochernes scorpioides]|uniref:Uncharacterized protein n=1 Tax=Cordylochernes scorpioides TaxID=51811 RepID=A0ABY6KR22_9ARAC|nr:hypothetical protein LAZ67_6003953 [Cordylochernes scorpioides]